MNLCLTLLLFTSTVLGAIIVAAIVLKSPQNNYTKPNEHKSIAEDREGNPDQDASLVVGPPAGAAEVVTPSGREYDESLKKRLWTNDPGIFWATVAGVVAVAAYTSVAAWQAYLMQSQLNEMRESFAVDRAYILFDGFAGDSRDIRPNSVFSFTFKNFGRTPADFRSNGGTCKYTPEAPPHIISEVDMPEFFDNDGYLPIGQTIDAGKIVGPFGYELNASQEEIEKAKSGIGKIYCVALIAYNDMRNNLHETRVCMTLKRIAGEAHFFFCPERGLNTHS